MGGEREDSQPPLGINAVFVLEGDDENSKWEERD